MILYPTPLVLDEVDALVYRGLYTFTVTSRYLWLPGAHKCGFISLISPRESRFVGSGEQN
jgi:hypothetical protein